MSAPAPVMVFKMREGMGAVPVEDILAIIPGLHDPAQTSVLYTVLWTDGIGIQGNSKELIATWQSLIEATPLNE